MHGFWNLANRGHWWSIIDETKNQIIVVKNQIIVVSQVEHSNIDKCMLSLLYISLNVPLYPRNQLEMVGDEFSFKRLSGRLYFHLTSRSFFNAGEWFRWAPLYRSRRCWVLLWLRWCYPRLRAQLPTSGR